MRAGAEEVFNMSHVRLGGRVGRGVTAGDRGIRD